MLIPIGEIVMSTELLKGLPLPFLFTLILQTGTIVWYISELSSTAENNSNEIIRQEARISSIERNVQNQAVMLARIDENLKAIRLLIEDIKNNDVQGR